MPHHRDDSEDRQVDVHAAEVPPGVRQAALARMAPGDTLWRCPRLGPPRGALSLLGVGQQSTVIEWWLLDAEGELIEAFWEE